MSDVRSSVRRAVLLVGVTVIAASCGRCGSNDEGDPVIVAPPPDYSNIGRAAGTPCVKTGNASDKCKGHPPRDFVDGAPAAPLSPWLAESRWAAESGPIQMEPESGTAKQIFRVAAVQESRRFEFRQHDNVAYVVARIKADPTGPRDRMYKIGGFTEPMRDSFYLVVRGYDDSDPTEPPDANVVGPSRRISRWEIYGITRNQPRLRLVSSGEVRWCGHPHATSPTEATVRYCQRDSTAASGAAQQQPVQLQLTSSAQMPFRDAPVWFTCGLGCCIADVTF